MSDIDEGHVRRLTEDLVPDLGTVARLTPLTGGLLNYVWRAEGVNGTAIVKHASPFVAASPDVALAPERIGFEARALQLFGADGTLGSLLEDSRVRVPELLAFLPDEHLLVEEDFGGGPDFAGAPADFGSDDTFEHARDLGRFIHALHARTAEDAAVYSSFHNSSVQRTRKSVQYDAVGPVLRDAGIESAAEAGAYAAELGEVLLNPGICLVMGDLWPRSILPREDFLGLIDWEFVHFGRPAQDIGHLGAHLWMLDRVDETSRYRDAWKAFRAAWPNLDVDDEVRVHFGCEIVARSVGAFSDRHLFASDREAAISAASRAAALITGRLNVRTIWEKR